LVAAAAAAVADAPPVSEADQPEDEEAGDEAAELVDAATESSDVNAEVNEAETTTDSRFGRFGTEDGDAPSTTPTPSGSGATDAAPATTDDDAAPPRPFPTPPPPTASTIAGGSVKDAWAPQTPATRNPADPTVKLDDGKKKRRWGRKK
jgi:hypothetical protein